MLCNFAGLLVIITIDDMIGAWACEYIVKHLSDEDEEFLQIKLTESEMKFVNNICLFLMFTYALWTSLIYKHLMKYKEGDVAFLYFNLSYLLFIVWPIIEFIFRKVFKCCQEPTNSEDEFKSVREISKELLHGDDIVNDSRERLKALEIKVKQINEIL